MAEEKKIKVNVIPLAYSFTDLQTGRQVKVKMSITDGSCQGVYNDRGVAKRIYVQMKQDGEKVVFLERKNLLIEAYPGKTAQEIRDYMMAQIKKSGRTDIKIQEGF